MKKRTLFTLLVLLPASLITAVAQGPERKGPRERLSPEMTARRKTEQMNKLLQLTEKQFKKVFKLNLKEAKSFEPQQKNTENSMRPHMRESGNGFSGRPPMNGGRPPMGNFNGEGPMRQHPVSPKTPEELKKEAQKRDKKLKKILTDRQYAVWQEHQNKIHGKRNPNH